MRLRGCSRATAYRIIRDGAAVGSLTLATQIVEGGNGAKQARRVVVIPDAEDEQQRAA